MTATVNAGDGSKFGIHLTTSVDIEPFDLGQAIARLTSVEQHALLVGFAGALQEIGIIEWRTQAAFIGSTFRDPAERHVVDEVFGEILAQLHLMDDRAEDARG